MAILLQEHHSELFPIKGSLNQAQLAKAGLALVLSIADVNKMLIKNLGIYSLHIFSHSELGVIRVVLLDRSVTKPACQLALFISLISSYDADCINKGFPSTSYRVFAWSDKHILPCLV